MSDDELEDYGLFFLPKDNSTDEVMFPSTNR